MESSRQGEGDEGNSDIFCDPCETDGKSFSAEGYCVNCDEYLCIACYKAHVIPSVTRHHMLKDKHCMPSKVETSNEMCQTHKEQTIEYYCETHKTLCCMVCKKTGHDNCADMNRIVDILNDLDVHQEMCNFKSKVTELAHDVDDTQYQIETSLRAIAINYHDAKSELCSLRRKINDHFDKVETNIDMKLDKIRNEDFEIINSHKIKCDALLFDISTLEAFLCKTIVAKHKYKAFIAMKRAENKVSAGHDDLKRIRQSAVVNRYEFVPETEVKQLLTKPGYFGDIRLTNACKKTLLGKGALNAKAEDNHQECHITGMTLMSEKYVVVADNNNMSVKLINTAENMILSQKQTDTGPWDLTSTKDNQVAVTLPSLEKIQFFRFIENTGLESVKELRIGKKCYGIEYMATDNNLIVTSCQPGMVEIIDLEGHALKAFGQYFETPYYVSWFPNDKQIVISDTHQNSGRLWYMTLDGQKTKSIEQLDNGYIQPLGLTTDHARGIFLCDKSGKVFFVQHYNYTPTKMGMGLLGTNNEKQSGFAFGATSKSSKHSGFVFATTPSTSTLDFSKFKRNEDHPDVLIDYSDISPRSIAYCKKTFTMYVGTKSNKIYMYVVA